MLHTVTTFDLDNPEIYSQIKADYDLVRETIRTKGFSALTGKWGYIFNQGQRGLGMVVRHERFTQEPPSLSSSFFRRFEDIKSAQK